MGRHACPRCGGPVDLVHRKSLDRIVSAFYKVRRYRCRGATCGWTGVLRSTHGAGTGGKGMKLWMWAIVIAISLAGALAMVAYLESRPSAETSEGGGQSLILDSRPCRESRIKL